VPYETILYDVRADGVATVALNQPDTRNALSNQLLSDLIDAFESARSDERVRCVVLTSTHEKVFSAGGSLDQFAGDVALVHKHFGTEHFPRLFRTIMQLGKPTICAANGHVLAGALGLALDEWAVKLAGKSPVLMKLGKDAMYRQLDMPFEDALDFLRSQLSIAFTTEDIQEGVKAFFEKREPHWTGR
jgi:enoyl-CoA hydratase/carnithine racemase